MRHRCRGRQRLDAAQARSAWRDSATKARNSSSSSSVSKASQRSSSIEPIGWAPGVCRISSPKGTRSSPTGCCGCSALVLVAITSSTPPPQCRIRAGGGHCSHRPVWLNQASPGVPGSGPEPGLETPTAVRPVPGLTRYSKSFSEMGGAKGTRTPGLLHAISRQHVHRSTSVQVTVPKRAHQSGQVRTGCCTFLLDGFEARPRNCRPWRRA